MDEKRKAKQYKCKIIIIHKLLAECIQLAEFYKKKHVKTKRFDMRIDFVNALLSGTAIVLIAVGFAHPPILLASALCSSTGFIITRVQDKLNLKEKYGQYNTTYQQYADLARDIQAVLVKNNMTSEEYQKYIVEINMRRGLIEDCCIF